MIEGSFEGWMVSLKFLVEIIFVVVFIDFFKYFYILLYSLLDSFLFMVNILLSKVVF